MMSRYREVADIVITYLEHKDRLVRLSITSLLPRIAHFLRDRFVTNYLNVCELCSIFHRAIYIFTVHYCNFVLTGITILLQICMNHILAVLRAPAERDSGFIALGEMAGALDGELVHYMPTIISHLRDAVCQMVVVFVISVIFLMHFLCRMEIILASVYLFTKQDF